MLTHAAREPERAGRAARSRDGTAAQSFWKLATTATARRGAGSGGFA